MLTDYPPGGEYDPFPAPFTKPLNPPSHMAKKANPNPETAPAVHPDTAAALSRAGVDIVPGTYKMTHTVTGKTPTSTDWVPMARMTVELPFDEALSLRENCEAAMATWKPGTEILERVDDFAVTAKDTEVGTRTLVEVTAENGVWIAKWLDEEQYAPLD
jgi:hypothetical protein